MKKIIAITGTPGTGKTTLAEKLAQKINAGIIDLTKIINKNKIYTGIDKSRDAKIVDISELKKFILNSIDLTDSSDNKDIIIEGHLSHFMPVTHIIVLRTNPKVLKKRLELRDYSKAKIKENLEAEFLGICLNESLFCENVIEIDTTDAVNLNLILDWLKCGGKEIKEIDWTADFCEVLKNF